MPLEDIEGAGKYLGSLVPANPASGDDRREGDNHIRGVKNTLRNTFPNVNSAIQGTGTDIDNATQGKFPVKQIQANNSADPAAPAYSFSNNADTGIYRPADDQVGIATRGVRRMLVDQVGAVSIPGALSAGSVDSINGFKQGNGGLIHDCGMGTGGFSLASGVMVGASTRCGGLLILNTVGQGSGVAASYLYHVAIRVPGGAEPDIQNTLLNKVGSPSENITWFLSNQGGQMYIDMNGNGANNFFAIYIGHYG